MKPHPTLPFLLLNQSPPVRGRGLKHCIRELIGVMKWVAPCAGAWVETMTMKCIWLRTAVAPCAGAWVETVDINKDFCEQPGRPLCGGVG